ncbi:hypothetical protein D3C78_1799270 [compost metagenome]
MVVLAGIVETTASGFTYQIGIRNIAIVCETRTPDFVLFLRDDGITLFFEDGHDLVKILIAQLFQISHEVTVRLTI